MEYLSSLFKFWKIRNSMESADYEERAFNSRIWFQKYWQRKRYFYILDYCQDLERILDVGCGSSQLLEGLPQSIGCDIKMNRLRYKRCPFRTLVQGSVFDLPFKDNIFDATILSQLIEHLPSDPKVLDEPVRVTKKGGIIVIGTPDYATHWVTIEKFYKAIHPRGFEDRHITKYTQKTLLNEMEKRGCKYIEHKYIFGAEIIIKFEKN
jgi:ubiquinone/menaquinone biosynthesis C-methylase UbiE